MGDVGFPALVSPFGGAAGAEEAPNHGTNPGITAPGVPRPSFLGRDCKGKGNPMKIMAKRRRGQGPAVMLQVHPQHPHFGHRFWWWRRAPGGIRVRKRTRAFEGTSWPCRRLMGTVGLLDNCSVVPHAASQWTWCWRRDVLEEGCRAGHPRRTPRPLLAPGEESSPDSSVQPFIPAWFHGGRILGREALLVRPAGTWPPYKVLWAPRPATCILLCPSVLVPKCFGCPQVPQASGRVPPAAGQSLGRWSYTMFSAPGRGPWGGPGSCLLCSWASCSTGMLQSGHTFRTSSHLMRHLGGDTETGGVITGVLEKSHTSPPRLSALCTASGWQPALPLRGG